MTYYDEAELVYLFSGAAGKPGNGASKAYAFKPDNKDVTVNRGSNLGATRIGKDGFLEKGRENLLLQSNQFDTTWSSVNVTVTGGQEGYDGSSDAWELKMTGAQDGDNEARIRQTGISVSGVCTYSVFAKAGNVNFVRIIGIVDGTINPIAYFDLSGNGSVTSSTSSVAATSIESFGNGWFRVSLTHKGAANPITDVRINISDGDDDVYVPTGSFIYIQDSQLEAGLVATDVITTGAATAKAGVLVDEPRFDYSKGEPRFMLEAKKQNLIPHSEYRTASQNYNTSWSFGYSSPEGLPNAYRLTATNGDNSHFAVTPVISGLVNGRSYCASIFVKPIAGNSCTHVRFGIADSLATTNVVYSYFDLTGDGAVGSNDEGSNSGTFEFAGIEKLPSGWFRIHIVGNIAVTSLKTVMFLATNGSNPVAFNDNTAAVDVYGVSFEQHVNDNGSLNGTKAITSYIPTHGVAVTRDFDQVVGGGPTLPSIAQDKYSFFAHSSQGEVQSSNRGPRLLHTSGSILATCGYFVPAGSDKQFFFDSNLGSGSNQRNITTIVTTSSDEIKYLFVVDNDNLRFKCYVDGNLIADTNMPKSVAGSTVRAVTARADFDEVRITSTDSGESDFLKTIMTFPTDLSHTEGQILTGATSFTLYEDMATANNYTVHV